MKEMGAEPGVGARGGIDQMEVKGMIKSMVSGMRLVWLGLQRLVGRK